MAREIVGWSGRLTNTRRNFLTIEQRALDPQYAAAECLWYLSGSDKVDMLLAYAPSYKNFAEPDGTAYGAYGARLRGKHDLLVEAIDKLKREACTRQCVITLWKPEDLHAQNKKDMPCTICWQFIIRRGLLHMCVYMRSNDVWKGFPYDVFCFTTIQAMIARELNVDVGDYVHNVGSIHLYSANEKAADEIRHNGYACISQSNQHGTLAGDFDDLDLALRLEQRVRTGNLKTAEELEIAGGGWFSSPCMLNDLVCCCARKFGIELPILSPSLSQGMKNVANRRS